MDCLWHVDDTLLLANTSQEEAAMLGVFATALNIFGLELDVPQAGQPINPNEPGAKMTAFCVNCLGEGIQLPESVDPEQRTCPYIREGTWKWLGRLWDPEGTWNEDTVSRCNKAWAVFSNSKQILLNRDATMTNWVRYLWATVGAVITANSGSRTWSDAQLANIGSTMIAMLRKVKAPIRGG